MPGRDIHETERISPAPPVPEAGEGRRSLLSLATIDIRPGRVGLLSLAELGPLLLTAFIGGALADWFDRRRLVQIAEAALALGAGALALNALLPSPQLWILFPRPLLAGLDGLAAAAFRAPRLPPLRRARRRRYSRGNKPERRGVGTGMRLEGVHHVTAITGDAPGNVDFYTRVLGLRLVKKTVNQDDPTVYHLFYADEKGSAGSDITFFEYPSAHQGRAGAGMVHTVAWRVASAEALDFWAERLGAEGVEVERTEGRLRFADPEGLLHELNAVETGDEPLVALHPDIPAAVALQGFDGVRAYTDDRERSRLFLEQTLAFEPRGERGWDVRGDRRGGFYAYDEAPAERGIGGAGTVHHVAWSSTMDDHEAWQQRVGRAGARPTPVIDRFYFRSVYFREPSGVLFEIATLGPGFTADEPLEQLGENLSLPPDYEHLRDRLEQVLTPLPDPRGGVRAS